MGRGAGETALPAGTGAGSMWRWAEPQAPHKATSKSFDRNPSNHMGTRGSLAVSSRRTGETGVSSPNQSCRRRAAARSVVLVVVAWGDEPATARTILSGQSLWLGDRPRDLPLPIDLGGGGPFRLVDFEGPDPRVAIPGRTEPGDPLALGATVSFQVAASTLSISRVEVDPALRKRLHPHLLPRSYVAGVALALFGLLALMALSLPLLGLADVASIERALGMNLWTSQHGTAEPEPPARPFELAASRTQFLVAMRGDMRCGDAEMGTPGASTDGRYAVEGPKDNPDPHIAAATGRRAITGPRDESLRRSAGADRRTPTAVWAREDALGLDPENARGAIWGDPIRAAKGSNGLGLSRVEGGWAKRFGWSALGGGPTRVLHAGLRVSGPLRPSLAARALAARFDRFRACYETAPRQRATVELTFDVTSSGTLSNPKALDSSGADPALSRCLTESLDGLTFAAVSAPSRVTYPLFFEPGTGSGGSVRPTHAAPSRKVAASCCGRP